jgi:hypothetical protein
MKLKDVANIRLQSQQIAGSKFKTAKNVVKWMGAMQAQDYYMAKWAVGVRLPGSTDNQIQTAINKGQIIRTHVLRPTWHFISPEDIYWMLELTAPQIKVMARSRDKELELTEKIYTKSNSIIQRALEDGEHLTREELMTELIKAKIATDNNRSSHLLLRAELEGIICSGAAKGKSRTYTLLEKVVTKNKMFSKDESLAKLAKKYFTSHCPATLNDFIWWSGLSVANAKHALEMVKSNFISETIGERTYWLTNSFSIPTSDKSCYLLPAYDEFMISYRDRSASLNFEHNKRTISINGIFNPIVVINGQITGLWKRTIKNNEVIIGTDFFRPHNKNELSLIKKAAEKFGSFLKTRIEIV